MAGWTSELVSGGGGHAVAADPALARAYAEGMR